jgi:hypothetical protein
VPLLWLARPHALLDAMLISGGSSAPHYRRGASKKRDTGTNGVPQAPAPGRRLCTSRPSTARSTPISVGASARAAASCSRAEGALLIVRALCPRSDGRGTLPPVLALCLPTRGNPRLPSYSDQCGRPVRFAIRNFIAWSETL